MFVCGSVLEAKTLEAAHLGLSQTREPGTPAFLGGSPLVCVREGSQTLEKGGVRLTGDGAPEEQLAKQPGLSSTCYHGTQKKQEQKKHDSPSAVWG